MIACAFPPTGGSGVQRTAKFVRYLPEFGWAPMVWARDVVPGLPRDDRLLSDVPKNVDVCRSAGDLWDRAWAWAADARHRGGVIGRIARRVNGRLSRTLPAARVPDDQIAWARRSVRPLERLIRKRRVRVIYSTFSPASNHWLALELKRRTGVAWVADFRDLWTDDYRYRELVADRMAAHRELEQSILETADAVIGVSKTQSEILASHVPSRRHRFVTITNGYDPADFKGISKAIAHERNAPGRDNVFVLAHVGRFDRWRANESLFLALEHFARALGDRKKSFRIHLVGHSDMAARERFVMDGVPYRNIGPVDHGEAVKAMASADALLLATPDGRNAASVIPAKVFEYLAAGRPILAVGPPGGEAETIVRTCQGGVTAGFSCEEIVAALWGLYDSWRDGTSGVVVAKQALARFQRRTLTERLAAVLDAVVAGAEDRLRTLALDTGDETAAPPAPLRRKRESLAYYGAEASSSRESGQEVPIA